MLFDPIPIFRSRYIPFLLLAAVFSGSLFALAEAIAQELDGVSGLEIVRIEIGFSGTYKVGYWTPVAVEIKSTRETQCEVEISVPDPDGAEVTFSVGSEPSSKLMAGQSSRVIRYVKFGRNRSTIRVRVRDAESHVAERIFSGDAVPTGRSSTGGLILAIGPEIGLSDALKRIGGDFEQTSVQKVSSISQLPDRWFGYESVNTIALTAGDAEQLESLSRAQIEAIREWIRLGGQLILSCARTGEKLLTTGGKLERLAPGKFVRTQPLISTSNLERFVESSQRISDFGELAVCILELGANPSELSESLGISSTAPLLARVPFGFGTIVWVGIDLDGPAFVKWPGASAFVRKVLSSSGASRTTASTRNELGGVSRLGYRDISGQLRSALDQLPGVQLINFSMVVGLLIVYLAIIGPGDYFILRNLRIPSHWTWLTFPIVVAAFTWGAIWLNRQTKGSELKLNQLDVVDFDVATATLRGCTWTHLYSPRNEHLSVRLRPQISGINGTASVLASWHGLPGDGLGGLDSNSQSAPFTTPFALRQVGSPSVANPAAHPTAESASSFQVQFENLPIHVAATRSLLFRWTGSFSPVRQDKLSAGVDGVLNGEVGNVFGTTLKQCQLVYNNWMYKFDRPLAPGQVLSIDRVRPLNLQWQLTQRQVVKQADMATPWDPAGNDMNRLLEVMLLYQAAGGESYTRLTNLYQPYLDLTSRIRNDWAVLIGLAEQPACQVDLDQENSESVAGQHWTVYRTLVPVSRESTNR